MDPYIGEIRPFAFDFAPRSWAYCAGETVSLSQYQALFALIGVMYGGDGRSTVGLPDLRGRHCMGQGTGPGLTTRTMGQLPGQENIRLTESQLAAHTHAAVFTPSGGGGPAQLEVSTTQAELETPDSGVYLAAGTNTDRAEAKMYIPAGDRGATVALGGVSGGGGGGGSVSVAQTGTGQNIPITNPALVLNFCIALEGIFPPRN